jgi:hypothetical protein
MHVQSLQLGQVVQAGAGGHGPVGGGLVAVAALEAIEAQVVMLLAFFAVHVGVRGREKRLGRPAHNKARPHYQQVVEQQEPSEEQTQHVVFKGYLTVIASVAKQSHLLSVAILVRLLRYARNDRRFLYNKT